LVESVSCRDVHTTNVGGDDCQAEARELVLEATALQVKAEPEQNNNC
jgi:hypothetical protein